MASTSVEFYGKKANFWLGRTKELGRGWEKKDWQGGFWPTCTGIPDSRELGQPRRRQQQVRHKFAYLTTKYNSFARFARVFFIFLHLADVLALSTTWNDLFCSCVDDVSLRWWMFNIVFLSQKRWFQFHSRTVTTHFASVIPLNNCEMIAETRSYIFRWRSRCRRRSLCLRYLARGNRRMKEMDGKECSSHLL